MPHPDQPTPSAVRTTFDAPSGRTSDSGPSTSRRAFLRGLVAAVGVGAVGTTSLGALAGCDIFGSSPTASPPAPPPPALQTFLTATSALGDRYDATLNAIDALPASIGVIRDAHRAHARALAEAIGAPTPAPSSGASAPDVPTDPAAALAALATAERSARDQAIKECLSSPQRFAALLGSIAAARATHLIPLGSDAGGERGGPGTPSGGSDSPQGADALAVALSAEHAAIYGYGVAGAHLDAPSQPTAREAETIHRNRRDDLLVRLAADKATPPAGSAAYTLPFPVTDRDSALKLAVELEDGTARAWRAAVAATKDDQRKPVLEALTDCAVRATLWRKTGNITPMVITFPGAPA